MITAWGNANQANQAAASGGSGASSGMISSMMGSVGGGGGGFNVGTFTDVLQGIVGVGQVGLGIGQLIQGPKQAQYLLLTEQEKTKQAAAAALLAQHQASAAESTARGSAQVAAYQAPKESKMPLYLLGGVGILAALAIAFAPKKGKSAILT